MNHGQCDGAAVLGVFQSVLQQIEEHLSHAALIGVHQRQVSRNVGVDGHVTTEPELFQFENGFGRHACQVKSLGIEQGFPARAAHLQQIL